ncbi:MAG: Hsp70 family protein [Alphaproteobacteria bacterium]|nr:Hsp70 family protein [Alphaproteobacteria bacterium]
MAQPRYSIGIDLGTSNSSLAYARLSGGSGSEVLPIAQRETATTVTEAATVPSLLYFPDGAGWIVGRWARQKAGETPGRVVHSAKSWLCHHAADRSAPFLPWGSDEMAQRDKISPVTASALILGHLRTAWDARCAREGEDAPFAAQDITITVPASFDAAAQKLTLEAAREAGFPEGTRLLEEPQAAFYRWLEQRDGGAWEALEGSSDGPRHVLVVDIGGGTSDFSLFELEGGEAGAAPGMKRIAVSDHILLGGDNIDLAIAHLLEPRLSPEGDKLSAGQWERLVARCRFLKEEALAREGDPDETFPVSIPSRGAGLIAGSLSAVLTRRELEGLLLDGFFPECGSGDRPRKTLSAMKEWGLPYAHDGAVTRHLAAFLRGRPRVDAVLFNGGSLHPRRLRDRLRALIGTWQDGATPQVLENGQLDLAVARGAAHFGVLSHRRANPIEAGAARAVFFEAHRESAEDGPRPLICILPHGAPSGQAFELSDLDLRLRVNEPVRFQVYTSTRHDSSKVGDVEPLDAEEFHPLPPLETIATVARSACEAASSIPVMLVTRINELGLLQVSCLSLALDVLQSWPLEFNLRPHENGLPAGTPAPVEPNAPPEALAEAGKRIGAAFPASGPSSLASGKREKMTAARLFQGLEQSLGCPRGDWNVTLVRGLWSKLEDGRSGRGLSVEHEETWLTLAGFFLRPGFGAAMDGARMDGLWRVRDEGARFPGKRIRLQEQILWRRVAGGLSRERQEILIEAEKAALFRQENAPPELIRMAGAFERLGQDLRTELVERFVAVAAELMSRRKHVAPYLSALGLLLNRTPFYTGPENVLPPVLVERAYEAFRPFDWGDPEYAEAQTLFLRAARAVDDRRLDLPRSLRNRIAGRLEKCGVAPVRVSRLRKAEPVERAERIGFFGESVPPGLILREAG